MIELTIRLEKREDGRMSIKFFPHKVEGDFIREQHHYDKICKIIGDYYFALGKFYDLRSYHSFESRTYVFDEAEIEKTK